MADLPITSDQGATPVVVNDPTTTANVANVKAASTASVAADNALVVALSPNSPAPLSPDRNVTGTIAALNGTVAVNAQGTSSVFINVTGTWVAVLVFEGFDGTNWNIISGLTQNDGFVTAAITSNQYLTINSGGYAQVRIRASSYTSGTANIFINAGAGVGLVNVYNGSSNPLFVTPADADHSVTATAATGVAVTATLTASANQYHHITALEITAYTTAARTGGATPVLVTSTNLPGANVWDFATAAAVGTTDRQFYAFNNPYRSNAIGTNTTIVCPATTGIIWRVNVYYFLL
jgi:hypothetical protein